MYKNFNLTESEKKQILNLHKSHGYKNELNEQTAPNTGTSNGFDFDLLNKKFRAAVDANSELATGKYQSNPQAQAAMIAKVKALEADYQKMKALAPPIPKPTTSKFIPPVIKHDEELTKPEPSSEETPLDEDETTKIGTGWNRKESDDEDKQIQLAKSAIEDAINADQEETYNEPTDFTYINGAMKVAMSGQNNFTPYILANALSDLIDGYNQKQDEPDSDMEFARANSTELGI